MKDDKIKCKKCGKEFDADGQEYRQDYAGQQCSDCFAKSFVDSIFK